MKRRENKEVSFLLSNFFLKLIGPRPQSANSEGGWHHHSLVFELEALPGLAPFDVGDFGDRFGTPWGPSCDILEINLEHFGDRFGTLRGTEK